jgi:alpha-mannosidase
LQLLDAACTDLFAPGEPPVQLIRLRLSNDNEPDLERLSVVTSGDGVVQVLVRRDAADLGAPVDPELVGAGADPAHATQPDERVLAIEVGVRTDRTAGSTIPVVIAVTDGSDHTSTSATLDLVVAEPGWTMWMVPHFHYDPVWWNTQSSYTSGSGLLAADGTTRRTFEHHAFSLIDRHFERAIADPDYTFVLAEVDYLKPYFDTHPDRRRELRALLDADRVEIVGATYNEPSTNLTGLESTIRNLVHGIGYQRDVLGADPQTAWQLDVFGHDPQFPGLLADAGVSASAWARGPFHQWGPILRNHGDPLGDTSAMQFPAEFEWIAPSGHGVLTHYMPAHYSTGWWMHRATTLADATRAVHALHRSLAPAAATRNTMLLVGTDFAWPNPWVTDIQRDWNARYSSPRFVCGIPRLFLDAVRAELTASGEPLSPQTRDMNPIYTGTHVSYIDTKQAQAAAEVAATDAEQLATIAAMRLGMPYPDVELDRVWRLLEYGAHHDAITGSEADQVYIDLLQGWREAYDLADDIRTRSLTALATRIDTGATDGVAAIVVHNTLGFERTDIVQAHVSRALLGKDAGHVAVFDDGGRRVPADVMTSDELDQLTIWFLAEAVPSCGWRTWTCHLVEADDDEPAGSWSPDSTSTAIANEWLAVRVDPARGGAIDSLIDRRTGQEVLRADGLGNELLTYEEYPTHPQMGEGPWHLMPKGVPVATSSGAPAEVVRLVGPLGERLVVTGRCPSFSYVQQLTLYRGLDRLEVQTRIEQFDGRDQMIRVRHALDRRGRLPVSDTAAAVIGRGFALPDEDSAEAPWALDNAAHSWCGLSSTARAVLSTQDGAAVGVRPFGVAEVVVADSSRLAEVRPLVVALARAGVTATTSVAGGARYGWAKADSNLPDIRIVVGGPRSNAYAAEVIAAADPAVSMLVQVQLDKLGVARAFVPADRPLEQAWTANADLRGCRAIDTILLASVDDSATRELLAAVIEELAHAELRAQVASSDPTRIDVGEFSDATTALITDGLPSFAIDTGGAVHLTLMRSCTGWPAGTWIDPPRRTVPDGSSFQQQHWTHTFRYALVVGAGDWRAQGLPHRAQAFRVPLRSVAVPPRTGDLPPRACELAIEPPTAALLSTVKPAGNPLASGSGITGPRDSVTVRLVEAHGTSTHVRLSGPLASPTANKRSVLETACNLRVAETRPDGHAVVVPLHGFEITTVTGALQNGIPVQTRATSGEATTYRPYWLHNDGPAPIGNLPVAVTFAEDIVEVTRGTATARLTVANNSADTVWRGAVTLHAPAGWVTVPATTQLEVPPGTAVDLAVALHAPSGAPDGLGFVAARLTDRGTIVEDVLNVVVGEERGRHLLPGPRVTEPPEYGQGVGDDDAAAPNGLDVEVLTETVGAGRPEPSGMRLRLTNRTNGEIRGVVHAISPWGTWTVVPRARQPFSVPAGAARDVVIDIVARCVEGPIDAWVLAKVVWFGRVHYTAAIALQAAPG